MQYTDYLTHMAALIKQNPSITVRELAAELSFADSKSVYYWLEKGNYGGINEFKRQVLSEEQPHPSSFQLEIGGVPHYLVILPLLKWNPKEKNPAGEWYYFHNHPQPRGLFALQVGTTQYAPWIEEQDILVISESILQQEESWVLLKTAQAFFIGKTVGDTIVDPKTLKSYPASFKTVGKILNQTRHLAP
ncbi:MAG: hypothetical protein GX956_06545 [Firmicutes bacterium]|nr:hypothetical protein [Bacillota bacterium]